MFCNDLLFLFEYKMSFEISCIFCSVNVMWWMHICCWNWCPSPPLDNIRAMVIVWRVRGHIIRTALCWIGWHNVHSQLAHLYEQFLQVQQIGFVTLSHLRFFKVALYKFSHHYYYYYWDPYAMRRGSCLALYYCNMVEWFWWDLSLISTTNWFNYPWNDL